MNYTFVTCALLILGATSAADAAGRQAALPGAQLAIDTPCARSVDIVPDPALHGVVQVQAKADHQEELDRLVLESKDGARIGHAEPGCWEPGPISDFSPTLTLMVRVPPGTPVAVAEGGVAAYRIGDLGGSLSLDLSGAGQVSAVSAAGLKVDLSGSGSVDVQRVSKTATIGLSGHGRVALHQATIGRLDADLSGAGGITVGGGQVGAAKLDVSGAGNIAVEAATGDAEVSVSGLGMLRFASVTGSLKKDVSGMGSVTVGPR